jgi:hypothetical protein
MRRFPPDEKMKPFVEEIDRLEGVETFGDASENDDYMQLNFYVEDMDALMSVGNRLCSILQFIFNTVPMEVGTCVGGIEYRTTVNKDKDAFTKPFFKLICEIPNDEWRHHCINVFVEQLKKMRLKYGTGKGNIQIEAIKLEVEQ